ncbi:hypothetical protein ABT317_08925 [Streptomyces carpinensis]|uniref:Uncharacterized protein n=1 Tax=Streptomyces carpinensis TaxID=66369 RepID=A0ABV1W0F1_9ACTN
MVVHLAVGEGKRHDDPGVLRVLFGAAPTHMVKNLYAERLRTWADWEPVAVAADGD